MKHSVITSHIVYVNDDGLIRSMPVILAGTNADIIEASEELENTIFTIDEDPESHEGRLSTKAYDLTIPNYRFKKIDRVENGRTNNCILCAVEQYLLSRPNKVFIEECDSEQVKASTLFGLDAIPVTVVITMNTGPLIRQLYVNGITTTQPDSVLIDISLITSEMTMHKHVSEMFKASVYGYGTAFMENGK